MFTWIIKLEFEQEFLLQKKSLILAGGGERDGVEECLCCDSLVSKIEKMVNFILVCRVSSTSVNAT